MNADDIETEELWNRPGLRIALVTETYPPEINGVARTLGCMVEGLIARGHRVQLIRPRQSSTDTPYASSLLDEVLSRGVKLPRYDGLHFGLRGRRTDARGSDARRP